MSERSAAVWYTISAPNTLDSGAIMSSSTFFDQIDPGHMVLEFVKPALEVFRSETFAPDLSLAMVLSAIIFSGIYWFSVINPALKALSSRLHFIKLCKTSQIFVDNLYHFDLSMREVRFLEHGWSKFLESCLLRDPHVQCSIEITQRPASFINLRDAEHFGLKVKWFASLSGIYVGVGLLFTFIGLVAALYFSSAAIQAVVNSGAELSGGDRGAEVQRALAQLLNTATFKFMTSIAGLGCSIALAIFDRKCRAKLDNAFDELCSELERCSVTITPEFLADRQYQVLVEIARRLNGISAGVDRITLPVPGTIIEPAPPLPPADVTAALGRLESSFASGISALAEALRQPKPGPDLLPTPMTTIAPNTEAYQRETLAVIAALGDRIEAAAGRIESVIDSGTRNITATILKAVDGNLASLLTKAVESGVSAARLPAPATVGGGEEQTLSADALLRIEAGVQDSATALTTITGQVAMFGEDVGQLKRDLSALVHQLSEAMRGNTETMAGFMKDQLVQLSERDQCVGADLGVATREAEEELGRAGARVAEQVADGSSQLLARVGAVIESLGHPIERLTRTMDSIESRIGAHLSAFEQLTKSVRDSEGAVVGSVNALRAASVPLIKVGDSLSEAMTAMVGGVDSAARSVSESQQAGHRLAEELRSTLETLKVVWTQHETRFNDVDQSVTRILSTIIGHAEAHGEALRNHVVAIDTHLAHTVNTLAANIDSLQEMVGDMTVAAQGLERVGMSLAVHPATPRG